MSVEAARLRIQIDTNAKKATAELDKTDKQTKKTGKSFKDFAKGIIGPVGITAALGAAAVAAVRFGRAAIQAASDAEETANRFNTVFGGISNDAEAAAKNLSDNFGVSRVAAQDLLAATGDLLTGFGFTQEAALDLSDQANQLAIDLASFTNVPIEQSSRAITSALTGETEALKSLGIVVRQGTTEFKNQVAAVQEAQGVTESQARAQVILQQAYAQSGNAIGDFSRSQDSLVNTQRTTQAAVENLSASLGQILLPAITRTSGGLGDLVRELDNFISNVNRVTEVDSLVQQVEEQTRALVDAFGGLADAPSRELNNLREDLEALITEQRAYRDELQSIDEEDLTRNQQRNLRLLNERLETNEANLVVLNRELESYDALVARSAQLRANGQANAEAEARAAEAAARYNDLWDSRTSLADNLEQTINDINDAEERGIITTSEAERQREEATQSALQNTRDIVNELNEIAAQNLSESLIPVNDRSELITFIRDLVTQLNGVEEQTGGGDGLTRSAEQAQAALQLLAENAQFYEGVVAGAKDTTEDLGETVSVTFADIVSTLNGFGDVASAVSSVFRANLAAQEQALRDRGATEEEIAEATLATRIKIAKQEKAIAKFSAIVNGAVAIQKALASAAPPFNFILAGLVGAQTALQIGAIQAQPIPTAQFGGNFEVPPGANQDSGLLRVNSGEEVNVTPARQSGSDVPDKIVVRIADRDFVGAVEGVFNKQGGRITKKGAIQTR